MECSYAAGAQAERFVLRQEICVQIASLVEILSHEGRQRYDDLAESAKYGAGNWAPIVFGDGKQ
jgi:hypothetical protein